MHVLYASKRILAYETLYVGTNSLYSEDYFFFDVKRKNNKTVRVSRV